MTTSLHIGTSSPSEKSQYQGYFPSRKLGRKIIYKSVLQRNAILILELDRTVDEYCVFEPPGWLPNSIRDRVPFRFRRRKRCFLLGVVHENGASFLTRQLEELALQIHDSGFEEFLVWTNSALTKTHQLENAKRLYFQAALNFHPEQDKDREAVSQAKEFISNHNGRVQIQTICDYFKLDPDRIDRAFYLINACYLSLEKPDDELSIMSYVVSTWR